MLELYRAALRLRREHLVDDEDFAWREVGADVLAFDRAGGFSCLVNLGSEPIDLPEGTVILSSVPIEDGRLPADAAAWVVS